MIIEINMENELLFKYLREKYIVRNNGEVYRIPRVETNPLLLDYEWTYGIEDVKTNKF